MGPEFTDVNECAPIRNDSTFHFHYKGGFLLLEIESEIVGISS